MSWKRRGRAVVCGALLATTCLAAMPSTGGAFPIKWWLPPQIGDPDGPGGTRLLKIRLGSFGLQLVPTRSGWLVMAFVAPTATSSRGANRSGR